LGRLYLIRGELNQAADAMALAAAQQLLGATSAFDAVAGTNGSADCSTATAVQVSVTADAPLVFFGLLPVAQARSTPVAAQAIAGVSAPLCTGCGIVPIGVPALNSADTVDFGFDASKSTVYTLYYTCSGTPLPAPLAGASVAVPYVLINRYDTASALPEGDQLFQYAAQGITASLDPTPNTCTAAPTTPFACVNVGDCETFWASAASRSCTSTAPTTSVEAALCGLYSRLDSPSSVGICSTVVPDVAALDAYTTPDTDVAPGETPPYNGYLGNGRRLITVAIVQGAGSTMTVLGFRQFLIQPNPDGTFFNPSDASGRFPALYVGNPAPLAQGWFDTRYAGAMCPVGSFSGPGKVVLHK